MVWVMSEYEDFEVDLDNVANFIYNGIVVNEERAKRSICKCIDLGDGDLICWCKGIIGALSKEQIEKYCPPEKRVITEESRLRERVERFRTASSEICKGLSLLDRIECMHIAMTEGLDKAKEFAEKVKRELSK